MTVDELETGKNYWFLSHKHDKLVKLTFMNKVHQRNAFRFAEEGKKQLFIIHASRLDKTYKRKKEGSAALKTLLGNRAFYKAQRTAAEQADRVIAYYTGAVELNPPRIDQWAVARGFPRRSGYGRW
jgi:hypothetical protein